MASSYSNGTPLNMITPATPLIPPLKEAFLIKQPSPSPTKQGAHFFPLPSPYSWLPSRARTFEVKEELPIIDIDNARPHTDRNGRLGDVNRPSAIAIWVLEVAELPLLKCEPAARIGALQSACLFMFEQPAGQLRRRLHLLFILHIGVKSDALGSQLGEGIVKDEDIGACGLASKGSLQDGGAMA